MARPQKRSAADGAQPIRKNKKQRTLQLTTKDETCGGVSSPEAFSDTEVTYVNEDGELRFDVFQEQMRNAERNMQDNKKRAREFELCVEQRRSNILTDITQHKEKIQTEQDTFDTAFLTVILSSLKPMALDSIYTDVEVDREAKLKTSMVARHNIEIFDYSEQLCKGTTDYLCVYSDLAKTEVPQSRIAKASDQIMEDAARVTKLIAAGGKKAKAVVQSGMTKESTSANADVKLLNEEENDAVLFERFGGTVSQEKNVSHLRWQAFSRGLTEAVAKIESLAED